MLAAQEIRHDWEGNVIFLLDILTKHDHGYIIDKGTVVEN